MLGLRLRVGVWSCPLCRSEDCLKHARAGRGAGVPAGQPVAGLQLLCPRAGAKLRGVRRHLGGCGHRDRPRRPATADKPALGRQATP